MSTQNGDGVATPSPDPRDRSQRDDAAGDADGTPAAAATPSDAVGSSRVRRSLPAADVDELVGARRRVQMRLGGVRSGMARSAAVASRTADEAEERRKRRREANTASKRKRRKAAAEAEEAASEGEGEGSEGEGGEGEAEGEGEGESGSESEREAELPSALYRWLEDPPDGQPPAPPPPSLPPPPTEDGPVVDGPPPRRSMYRRGKKGRRTFHRERAEWYERATGHPLEGSLT